MKTCNLPKCLCKGFPFGHKKVTCIDVYEHRVSGIVRYTWFTFKYNNRTFCTQYWFNSRGVCVKEFTEDTHSFTGSPLLISVPATILTLSLKSK